ncbi:MAG: MBL fold metallo-hydrolase [Chloroflexi bacterium]|nr:MBL fold metallo-hydrolase [Chloroflexota bacterium]
MEIDWFGHSCFRLRGREGTVITDPYSKEIGLSFPRPRADIVTISHDHPGHHFAAGVRGDPRVIEGPGEYEIKNIFVTGIPTSHDKKGGKERGPNTVYTIEMDGLTICHLGDLGHVPSQAQVDTLGDVNILLIPAGNATTIGPAEAAEVVSLLEPQIVIPMHFALPELTNKLEPPTKFFKQLGVKPPGALPSFKVTKDSLPQETQVVLLEAKQRE